jgi:hypothetical protein
MTALYQIEVAQLLVVVSLLWFFYSFMYRRSRCDRFREDIFTLRDELFDEMAKLGGSFELAEYTTLRSYLNGLIRGAGFIRASTAVVMKVVLAGRSIPSEYNVRAQLETVQNDEIRERLLSTFDQAGLRAFRFIFFEGVSAVVFWPAFWIASRLSRYGNRQSQFTQTLSEEIVHVGRPNSPEGVLLAAVSASRCR